MIRTEMWEREDGWWRDLVIRDDVVIAAPHGLPLVNNPYPSLLPYDRAAEGLQANGYALVNSSPDDDLT